MSNINGLGGNNPVYKVTNNPIQRTIPTDAPQSTPRASDRLELSGLSGLLQTAKQNDVRLDKVAELKAAIADGSYENDQKMDIAIDKLLDDLMK